jgi:solute carrier family 25 (mitochondrial iron transporter), member 28/37
MQCQRCPRNGKPLNLTAIATARKLIAEEGPLRLFRGVSTMLSASLPAHAVYFSVFEAAKTGFGADSPDHTPLSSGTLLCVCSVLIHLPLLFCAQALLVLSLLCVTMPL